MITHRAKYALKALLHLAQADPGVPALAGEIAAEEDIPPAFLERILLDLRKKGLVRSRKGPGGGHALAREPKRISLLEVLRAIDGPVAPLPCLSRTAYVPCPDCRDEETCGVRAVLAGVHEATLKALGRATLADGVRLRHELMEAKRGKHRRR